MKHRKLGQTDWQVSEIGFGAWALGGQWGGQDDQQSLAALHRAIDLGVNFLDTAEVYGDGRSERLIGQFLPTRSEQIYVATKTAPTPGPWPPSPYCQAGERYPEDYLRQNVEQRLRNLGLDTIDLLQLHTWTRAWNRDPEPLEVLRRLRDEGKIRHIGVSTPEHDQNSLVDLMRNGWVDSIQVIYNLFEQEPAAELLTTAAETNTGVIVRMVFDEGVLTGKYGPGHQFPDDDFRNKYFEGDRLDRAVGRVARIREDVVQAGLDGDYTMADIAINFVLAHSAVSTVIAGIRTAEQAELNVAACEKPDLPRDLLVRLRRHNWLRSVWYPGK